MSSDEISTELSIDNIIDIIEILRKATKGLKASYSKLGDKHSHRPLADGKRSYKETLIHLIHCEMSSTSKIFGALLENNPEFENIHPEKDWGEILKLEKLEVKELLRYFDLRRKVLLETLHSLGMDQWASEFRVAEQDKTVTVYEECREMALYEHKHIRITKTRIKKLTK